MKKKARIILCHAVRAVELTDDEIAQCISEQKQM